MTESIEIEINMFDVKVRKGRIGFMIRNDCWMTMTNYKPTNTEAVAKGLGVSEEYVNGIYDGLNVSKKYMRDARATQWDLEKEISRSKMIVATEEKAKLPKLWRSLNKRCDELGMPVIPPASHLRGDVVKMRPFSGIYFAWDGLLCVYVGRSRNVPRRMKTHKTVEKSSYVSFIQMPHCQIGRAECFYIWLLHPPLNRSAD